MTEVSGIMHDPIRRVILLYLEYYEVYPFVRGVSPGTKGGGATLPYGWGGGWEEPMRTTGEKAWHSAYTLWPYLSVWFHSCRITRDTQLVFISATRCVITFVSNVGFQLKFTVIVMKLFKKLWFGIKSYLLLPTGNFRVPKNLLGK